MEADWAPVTIRRTRRTPGETRAAELERARRAGTVETERKFGAGGNRSSHVRTDVSMTKLEDTDDVIPIKKLDTNFGREMSKARTAKGMTQKELAVAINEKPSVVGDYENNRAIPNPAIIVKIERALGVHLPRPPKPAKKATDDK